MRNLAVDDHVTHGSLPAKARYIIAPSIRLSPTGTGSWELREELKRIASVNVAVGRATVTKASHAPQFGVVSEADCLTVALVDGRASTRWTWPDDER
jgi:hypothetical protein